MTLCALVLASCASLPTLTEAQRSVAVVPAEANSLQQAPPPQVQLQGARGALSNKQSQIVLDRLERNAPETDILSIILHLKTLSPVSR